MDDDYVKRIETEINKYKAYGKEEVTLENCDREPIHLIGHIQPHGVLIVANLDSPQRHIDFVSQNIFEALGLDNSALLAQPLEAIFSHDSVEMMVESLKRSEHTHQTRYELDIHSPIKPRVEASFHQYNRYLLIELQPFLSSNLESTGFDESIDDCIRKFTSQMFSVQSFDELAQFVVSFFHEELKYDRVMVYKFDGDGHGEVIAEQKKAERESFLGLHYPATDIPQFARYLYVQNRCRIIADISATPVPILATDSEMDRVELDLRLSNLRSMSPIHIEYLANMGITASLTMSIVKDGELFGMVIMHHYSPIYCTLASRDIINRISDICSDYVGVLEKIESIKHAEHNQDLSSLMNMYLFDYKVVNFEEISRALMQTLDADGLHICINGETLISIGLRYPDQEVLVNNLEDCGAFEHQISQSDNVSDRWPQLSKLNPNICGLMILSLPSDNLSFILIARAGQATQVRWAGRKEKYVPESDGRLHARRSFQEWREVIKDRSKPWTKTDTYNAENIRAIFIRYLLRLNERRLAKIVSFDGLTALPNRNFITNYIDNLLSEGVELTLLFIDCDRFKTINDSLGHDVGDKVLQTIGNRLKKLEAEGVIAARLGGDEFILVVHRQNAGHIRDLADNLVESFRHPISFDTYSFYVPVSVGIAVSSDTSTRSSLMREADMAMYEAKNCGGNDYKFVSRELIEKANDRLTIEHDLHVAISKHQIVNYYQPIVNGAYEVHGYEVLCRWVKSETETIPPLKFLGVAEETGLIISIGLSVIEQAIADLKSLHVFNSNLILSINFSPRQIVDKQTLDFLIDQVDEVELDPSRIWVELTEESYIEDEKSLIAALNRLKTAGFQTALDDFGSGYSSMKYLTVLPLDVVKFDKSLIDTVSNDPRALGLLKACKELADVCNLSSVAEGIETVTQKNLITDIGIVYQQGYFWGKPEPFSAVLQKLKES